MANVKISNLPVETVLANMTGIAGYNASGTAQISGATIDSAFAKSTSDLQFIVDNGNAIDSNAGTGSIIFKNGGSNTNTTVSVNSISSDTSFSIIGTTNNTNLTFTSGGELRFTPNASLGTPAQGDVLAAKNAFGDVEWVPAGGSTPGIVDVLNAGYTANTGQVIALTTGGTVTTYAQTNIQCGGSFSITQGTNDLLTLGSAVSAATLAGGAGAVQVGDTGNNLLISTNSSDKIQLSCNGTGEVEFYLGLNNPGPAIGDVLTAKSTAGAVEWTTPIGGAFSPIDVASSETAPTAATTQYYYQTIAGATMTISKAKLWGFQGTNTVLFGIYRGTFGSLTLIGQGSATCSTGPNVINLVAEPGQSLSVTAGEDIVVGFYPSGTSWRTIYDDGISDIAFGISNTANITSMPASPTGGASSVRFACTLY